MITQDGVFIDKNGKARKPTEAELKSPFESKFSEAKHSVAFAQERKRDRKGIATQRKAVIMSG